MAKPRLGTDGGDGCGLAPAPVRHARRRVDPVGRRLAVAAVTAVAAALLAAAGWAAGSAARAAGTAAQTGRRQARPAPARPARATIVEHGSRRRRWVALTFDADMTYGMRRELRDGRQRSWVDARLLDELRATRTPATIFLTGLWTRTYPSVVRSLARDPLFELENHSYDHAAWESPCYGLPTVSTLAQKRRELLDAERVIVGTAGVRPRLFRFPGVCHSRADIRLVARLGLQPVDGDVVSGDAFNPSTAAVVRTVLAGVRPGSIVIAHCIGAPNAPATAAAMAQIIPALRDRGYRFVTLGRLLGR